MFLRRIVSGVRSRAASILYRLSHQIFEPIHASSYSHAYSSITNTVCGAIRVECRKCPQFPHKKSYPWQWHRHPAREAYVWPLIPSPVVFNRTAQSQIGHWCSTLYARTCRGAARMGRSGVSMVFQGEMPVQMPGGVGLVGVVVPSVL